MLTLFSVTDYNCIQFLRQGRITEPETNSQFVKKKIKRNSCLMSVFISDKDTAKL